MRRSAAGLVIGLALVAAACGSSTKPAAKAPNTSGSAQEYVGDDAGFYNVPSPLPGKDHGDLIRYQKLPDVPGGRAYRVMYRSTSVQGAPIAVTGLAAVPAAAGKDRVVLTWAHGTTGIADVCAPSKTPAQTFDVRMQAFLSRGWDVVATDYEGLGTPGRHPYLAGVSEGRGTLDIVRAVQQLPSSDAGNRTIVWGHSQGGHAAVFADQLAASWTPELRVLGTVAGAPPSELPLIAGALKGGNFQGYLAMAAAGINAAYPQAKLEDLLTPKGLDLLPVVDTGCTDKIFAAYNGVKYEDFAKADPSAIPSWKQALEDNDPGHSKLESPLLIIHGEADEQIPPIASALLMKRLCAQGETVERRTYPGMRHAEVIVPSFDPMLTWMDDRVAGKPATNGCS